MMHLMLEVIFGGLFLLAFIAALLSPFAIIIMEMMIDGRENGLNK